MSWASVRAGIVSAVEGLTPGDATSGETAYTHVLGEQIEESFVDRRFVVRMTAPPAQVGQIINGTSWRWLTQCEVVVAYVRGHSVEDDEDRIAADAQQLQQTLLVKSNHHADVEGVVAGGDTYVTTGIDDNDERNYLMSIGFAIHHL